MKREELSKEIQQFFGEIKQREKDLAEAKADLKSIGEAMVTARLSADVAMLRELAAESKEAEEKVLQEDTEPFEEDFFFDDENTDQNKT